MIIVPDDPGPASPDEVLKAAVRKVFDGDGFLANVWHPYREAWVERVTVAADIAGRLDEFVQRDRFDHGTHS